MYSSKSYYTCASYWISKRTEKTCRVCIVSYETALYIIHVFPMQFIYKLYILYINFINMYESIVYTCIVYIKNHTETIQKPYIVILAMIKDAL